MIRCYKYFALPASHDDADKLHGQCRLAGDYRRVLVDIENRSRALQRALWSQPMRTIPIPDRAAWRTAGGDAELRAWTKTDEYKVWRDQITRETYAATKLTYGAAGDAGLAWGTRLAVGEAVDHARRTTKWVDDLGNAASNRVAVQIQITKPLSSHGLVGGEDTRLRIDRDPYALGERIDGYQLRAIGEARNRSGNVRPRRFQRASLRVGSTGRDPVWAHLHVLMHRPLPEGQIKGAWAQRRSVGGRWEWEIVISIDMGERLAPVHPCADKKAAIDLGWRRRDNGIRVAYWIASDGHEGEVVIPIEVERRKGKSDDLHSIRDRHRNDLALQLHSWLVDHRDTWLTVALAHAHQWTRMVHFVRLEQAWAAQRVAGDDAIYEALRAFLKQDRHLHAWQANNLVKMQRQIRGRFDAFAHDLCKRYGTVTIEDLDLTQIKELPDEARIASRSIQKLAPGELLRAVEAAAGRYGCTVRKLDPANTTLICAECGHVRVVDDQRDLVLACDSCGASEDQDRTAARNLLYASDRVQTEDAPAKIARKLAPRRTRKRVMADRSHLDT